MHIRLIHNPKAGEGDLSEQELFQTLRSAGHEVTELSSRNEAALDALTSTPGELVVIAGGDGTVGMVAKRLAGRGIPLAVLAMGTANNIANTLGVCRPVTELVAKLESGREVPFDVGVARSAKGEVRFLESVGGGLFAKAMLKLARQEQRGEVELNSREQAMAHAIDELRRVLDYVQPRQWRVELDGHDHSGRYLLVEALNTPVIGPNLRLAPEADPADGLLDVVLLGEEDREWFDSHLKESPKEAAARLAHGTTKAQHVILEPQNDMVHVDDEAWPDAANEELGPIDLHLLPHALTFVGG